MTEPKKILLVFLIVMAIGLVALAVERVMEIAGRWWIMLASISLAVLILLLGVHFAQAHKPEHMKLHEMFYETWMMPDNRSVSCCNKDDCEPAQAYEKDGAWYARKISEINTHPEYVRIPPKKVEYDRDSPDGQSHICGRRYGASNMEMSVFCFKAGAGG